MLQFALPQVQDPSLTLLLETGNAYLGSVAPSTAVVLIELARRLSAKHGAVYDSGRGWEEKELADL